VLVPSVLARIYDITIRVKGATDPAPLAVLTNEFASVRVSVDEVGHTPRLLVEDLETGAQILLSPIELASLCLASADDRVNWLRVGQYRDERS
jgi:hypothetical protein